MILTISLLALTLIALVIAPRFSFKRSIQTAIEINTSAEKVYAHMADFDHYNQWSPFIKSIHGNLEKNEVLRVLIQPQGKSAMEFKPTLLNVEQNKEIRWLGKLGFKGIFDGEHYFILEKINHNKTRLIHGESFKGVLVPMLWSMIKHSTKMGFKAHNSALKNISEANSRVNPHIQINH